MTPQTPPSKATNVPSDPTPMSEMSLIQQVMSHFYSTKLNANETTWRDHYEYLLEHGYQLRPRYRPGWSPSWVRTRTDPSNCEDAIEQIPDIILDAMRIADGTVVCIKRTQRKSDELEVGRYLSSLPQDTKNHCVAFLDAFADPRTPDTYYIVMPVLRSFDDPEFGAVGEIVDFVTQVLEGMAFMHSNLVAHGDLTGPNIMMDARPIFPRGWHFVADYLAPNGIDVITPLARIDHPVRYIIIDYDCAVRFLPGQSHLIHGHGGRDGDVPELATHQPYDPFKMDVFTVGNLFYKEFYQKYIGLDFLVNLMKFMMIRDFNQRPSAEAALQHWYNARKRLDVSIARWRLRKRTETVGERVVLDTVAAARQGIHSVKRLFNGDETKPWSTT